MERADARPEVDIRALRSAVNLILDHVEHDLGIKRVAITKDRDFYWDLNIDDLFKVDRPPPTLTMGSTKDDLEFLATMVERAQGTTDAPALMLMHVTPLLNLICDAIRG